MQYFVETSQYFTDKNRIISSAGKMENVDNRVTCKSVTITSELPDYSRTPAITCAKVYQTLERKISTFILTQ